MCLAQVWIENARDIATRALTGGSELPPDDTEFESVLALFVDDPVKDSRKEIFAYAEHVAKTVHRDCSVFWDAVSAWVIVLALREITEDTFVKNCIVLDKHVGRDGNPNPLISLDVHRMAFMSTGTTIHNAIDHTRDALFTYSTIKELVDTCLLCDNDNIPLERPQYMYMRAACATHSDDVASAVKLYDLTSQWRLLQPTAWMAQLGSRSCKIAETEAPITIEMWVEEIEDYLTHSDVRKAMCIRDWTILVPDLFMMRYMEDGNWSFFPDTCFSSLSSRHSTEFERLYCEYEKQGLASKTIQARTLMKHLCDTASALGNSISVVFKDQHAQTDNLHFSDFEEANACVPWDTCLWTREFGPVPIGSLVPSESETYEEQQHKSFDKKLLELRALIPDIHDEDDADVLDLENRINDLEMAKKALPIPFRATKPTPVHVYTGTVWVEVTPQLTGKKQSLLRIETSHGVRMDCTPSHKWLLEDGRMVTAAKLQVGDRLAYTRPIMHTPTLVTPILEKEAFMLGAVYAYVLRMKGETLHDNIILNTSVSVMQLRRATLLPKALDMFGYDEKAIRAKYKDVDHDAFVIVEVPPLLSQRRTLFQAELPMRMAWVAGYTAATEGGNHTTCITCYKMLRPVVDMYRSTGENVKMIPVGRRGHYLLCPVNMSREKGHVGYATLEDSPTVAMKHLLNAKEDVYCVSSEHGRAAFEGGHVTGNCENVDVMFERPYDPPLSRSAVNAVAFLDVDAQKYDFSKLHDAVKHAVRVCDSMIDVQSYNTLSSRHYYGSNRPIGLGVVGVQETLHLMGVLWMWTGKDQKFTNATAMTLIRRIFETVCHASLEATCDLADEKGIHSSFMSTAASRGLYEHLDTEPDIMYDDWNKLLVRSSKGRRNASLVDMARRPTTLGAPAEGLTFVPRSRQYLKLNTFLKKTISNRNLESERVLTDYAEAVQPFVDQYLRVGVGGDLTPRMVMDAWTANLKCAR